MALWWRLRLSAKKVVIACSLLVWITIIHYITWQSHPGAPFDRNFTETKLVLLWTPFFGTDDWLPEPVQKSTWQANCPVKCAVTSDKTYFKQAHALVFHERDVGPMPLSHPPWQRWIFFSQEAPVFANLQGDKFVKQKLDHVFNLTATYHSYSDIPHPYGGYRPRGVKSPHIPPAEYQHTGKKLALWLVSNCKTPGKREKYVAELEKHMHIDKYGKCYEGFSVTCPKGTESNRRKCEHSLKQKYKFYMAFENTKCPEYVTEKFWGALHDGLVPVVFGASLQEYTRIAPPNSFIHVDNFHSAKELANYLLSLDKDDDAYNKYLAWREKYELGRAEDSMCAMCKVLHNKSYPAKVHKMSDWYRASDCNKGVS